MLRTVLSLTLSLILPAESVGSLGFVSGGAR
jgi:hypothetical protein